MGLVRAEAARVAERRRARPCRVLLVDETSIRRRHRYVTVVACGDSGKVLAMIPGRTKGSLSRFFRDQGAWWCRQVEIVVSDGILLVSGCHRRSTCRMLAMCWTGSMSPAGSPKASPWYAGSCSAADPQLRPPTFEPDLFGNLFHSAAPGRPSHRRPPSPSRSAVRRSSTSPNRPGRASRALPAV